MTRARYRALDGALRVGVIPDPVLRAGGRRGTRWRVRHETRGGVEASEQRLEELLHTLSSGPIAELPEVANAQHYELPSAFFELLLGPNVKYSSGLWEADGTTLEESEEAMLAAVCDRAGIEDGMCVLDLGCGWGALALWVAARYPNSEVTAVSNSQRQHDWITQRARRDGLNNLQVHTCEITAFEPNLRFDRIVSIEMFEHMRNWRELLRRISTWLSDDGRAFIQVFSHASIPYRFEGTWAAERFFSAGLMPSHDLLLHFQDHLTVERRWAVSGQHYARTLDAWLRRLDARAGEAIAVLEADGRTASEARLLLKQWRLFLISTQMMWGSRDGNQWMVSHYRLRGRW
ncbi:MAG: class I SAM-dependent methyltransferase [Solirubrobacteraceae bacterium]|nr:class I SAM-dependent methyltransferase [Solirubrobacteraceae bacterium]